MGTRTGTVATAYCYDSMLHAPLKNLESGRLLDKSGRKSGASAGVRLPLYSETWTSATSVFSSPSVYTESQHAWYLDYTATRGSWTFFTTHHKTTEKTAELPLFSE